MEQDAQVTADALGTLIFYSDCDDFDTWRQALHAHLPSLPIRRWQEVQAPEAVHFALVWNPPVGFFRDMTNLKLIVNLGAGVDSLAGRSDLPPTVPVTRLSDPQMARMMASYVLLAVLRYTRDLPYFETAQQRREWAYRHPRNPEDIRVAVLGLGELGARAAIELQRQGLHVLGWSRSPKHLEGIGCHAGLDALDTVLAQADILVIMLPSTPDTRGLLSRERLLQLPRGAALINVARGDIVDQAALTALLQDGHIGAATLDVFEREPMPPEDPLWSMPNVLITPHIASVALPRSATRQIAENIVRVAAGHDIAHRVDLTRGY